MDKNSKSQKKKDDNENSDVVTNISSIPIEGQPKTSFDIINKYGTYEIQPTSDAGNDFPTIAQGLPKGENVAPRVTKNPHSD